MTETTTAKEVYLFKRDEAEEKRLNHQHNILKKLCYNSLLDSRIALDTLETVADIGTGTGIWLEDVAEYLSVFAPLEHNYVGFDISTKHFPVPPASGMSFHQHDILQPFPAEHQLQYDLVHIRLLVLALRKDQFQTAIANVVQLLKPGGFIQWEEFETKNMTFIPPSAITSEVRGIMRKAAQSSGLTNTPCADIKGHLEDMGFEKVTIVDFDSSFREDFDNEAREWTKGGARAGLYYALLRDGSERSPEETRILADRLLDEYTKKIDEDVVPTMPLARVFGQKPR